MKKMFVTGVATALTLCLLSGCGSKKENSTENATANSNTQVLEESSERIDVSSYKIEDYVKLGEYQNIAVTVSAKAEITDEQAESQALAIYQNYATKENGGVVDRAVNTGDTVIMDYVGKKDGVAFQGGTAQDASLTIGSGQFIPGFEDGLIGVKPGETVDLNLTFPEQYHSEELAGAKVVFTVTVHYIVPTDMKDEVVAGFGFPEFSNVKALKDYCKNALEANAESAYRQELMGAIFDQVIANSTFSELPEELLQQYEQDIKEDLAAAGAAYGVDGATYVTYVYNADYDTFVTENANYSAKMLLTNYALLEKENLLQGEEELEKKMEQFALDNGWDSLEHLLTQFDRERIKESVLYEEVLNFLLKSAKVTHQ